MKPSQPDIFGKMRCRIRPLTAADIVHVSRIEQACFPAAWSPNALFSELHNPYAFNIVINGIDSLDNLGIYAYSYNHIIGNELSILRMAVTPEKRRLGIGIYLMETVLRQATVKGAEKAFLEVRPSNKKAGSLYRKLGFRVVGTRPNYYPETGEHALVMMKRLKEKS
jgi:ribosomal-protein-alanine N-acetyltransferase